MIDIKYFKKMAYLVLANSPTRMSAREVTEELNRSFGCNYSIAWVRRRLMDLARTDQDFAYYRSFHPTRVKFSVYKFKHILLLSAKS